VRLFFRPRPATFPSRPHDQKSGSSDSSGRSDCPKTVDLRFPARPDRPPTTTPRHPILDEVPPRHPARPTLLPGKAASAGGAQELCGEGEGQGLELRCLAKKLQVRREPRRGRGKLRRLHRTKGPTFKSSATPKFIRVPRIARDFSAWKKAGLKKRLRPKRALAPALGMPGKNGSASESGRHVPSPTRELTLAPSPNASCRSSSGGSPAVGLRLDPLVAERGRSSRRDPTPSGSCTRRRKTSCVPPFAGRNDIPTRV